MKESKNFDSLPDMRPFPNQHSIEELAHRVEILLGWRGRSAKADMMVQALDLLSRGKT
jgi:hypothetical protein